MSYLTGRSASAIMALLFLISCNSTPVRFSRIEYNIPDNISVKADDLKTVLEEIKIDPSADIYIVLTLYSYSSGAESLSFSGVNDVKTVNSSGKLKVLVKVMDGKKILRAEFIEAIGNNKQEMLLSLVKEIKLKVIK